MSIEEQIQNNLTIRRIVKLEINSNYSTTGTCTNDLYDKYLELKKAYCILLGKKERKDKLNKINDSICSK